MKILSSKQNGNTVSLEVEQGDDNIQKAMDQAFQRLVKDAKVAGFRKGKIPRTVFEKHYGRESIIEEAIKDVVNDGYASAVAELKLKVIDYPRDFKIGAYKVSEPLKFTCNVQIMPEVKLGKYSDIKVKKEVVPVDESKIQKQLEQIQEQYAQYQPVDRAAASGDVIRCHMNAFIGDEPFTPWTRQNSGIWIGSNHYGKDFDAKLIGLKKEQKESFSIDYPADYKYSAVAGKSVRFDIEVTELLERKLPEFTEEFISKVSRFKNLDELTAHIKEELGKHSEKHSHDKLRSDLMEIVLKDVKVELPEVLVEREVDFAVAQFEASLRRSSGISLEQYLKASNKTIEQVRKDYTERATHRVKQGLTLDTIADKEKIEITDADLEAEIASWGHGKFKSLADVRNSDVDMDNLEATMRQKKTVEFLVSKAKITS